LPFPLVLVEVDVVVVVVVEVDDVVLVVVVGGGAVELVVVVVDVGTGTVEVVVVGTVGVVEVVLVPPPLSEAMTTSATISPITTATSSAIAHLTPRLMPPVGGWPGGGGGSGWPMWRVGSSCIARECTSRAGRDRGPAGCF
jgi:hypothetical protein